MLTIERYLYYRLKAATTLILGRMLHPMDLALVGTSRVPKFLACASECVCMHVL